MTGLSSEAGGTAGGGGLDKDLATLLRRCIDQSRATYVPGTPENYPAAELRGLSILDAERVEAELSRLREQRDALAGEGVKITKTAWDWKERAEAAEARLGEAHQECARLQQALRAFFDEWDGDVGTYAPTDDTEALMREALAGQPTAAEGQDTPADSRLREYVCAHDHRWFMQPAFAPNGCPMCNTISFKRADSQPEEPT